MSRYVLKLYITGETLSSQRAITSIQRLCEEQFAGQYDLTIIDIQQLSPLAQAEQVFATPTLIRESPLPCRRLVGDFSQVDRVLMELESSQ